MRDRQHTLKYARRTTTLAVALTRTPTPLYATQRYKPALRLDACANDSRDVAVVETTSALAPTTSTSGSSTRYHVISPTTLIGLACTTHSSDTRDVSLTTCFDVTFTISAATVANHAYHTLQALTEYAPKIGLKCHSNEAETAEVRGPLSIGRRACVL